MPSIINGILVTVMGDMGPLPVVNTSTLDELIGMKLGIAGMTLLSLGMVGEASSEQYHLRLHGPMPVPDTSDLEALGMSFRVTPTSGKAGVANESTLWIIFSSEKRHDVLSYHNRIQSEAKSILAGTKTEADLQHSRFADSMMKALSQATAGAPTSPPRPKASVELERVLGFYTVDSNGDLKVLESREAIELVEVLIFVNPMTETIFTLKVNPNASKRVSFLAGRTASQLNLKRFSSSFRIRDISDEMDVNYFLERIRLLVGEFDAKP